jgi:hypothetical protein
MKPASPVRSSPPGSAFADSSGRFQYPGITCGPLIAISPVSPTGTSSPESSRMRETVPKIGASIDRAPDTGSPGAAAPNGVACVGAWVSVSP